MNPSDNSKHQSVEGLNDQKKVVGTSRRRFLGRFSKKWLFAVGVVSLIIVVGIGYFVWWNFFQQNDSSDAVNSDVVFVIAEREYSKSEIENIISYPRQQSPDTDINVFARKVYDIYLKKADVESSGITVGNDEIEAAKIELFPDELNRELAGTWAWLVAYEQVLDAKIANQSSTGNAEGYVFVFGFTSHMKLDSETPPQYTDEDTALIEADKAYAKERAESYRSELQQGSVMPDQLISLIQADSRLYSFYQENGVNSVKFEGLTLDKPGTTGALRDERVLDYITTAQQSGFSDVVINQDDEGLLDGYPTSLYYFFVTLDKTESEYKNLNETGPAEDRFNARYEGL